MPFCAARAAGQRAAGAVGQALQQMRGAMVHGIADERVSHDCIYVLFTARAASTRSVAVSPLLTLVDSALRRSRTCPAPWCHATTGIQLDGRGSGVAWHQRMERTC